MASDQVMRVTAISLALFVVVACASAARVRVSLVQRPPILATGQPWTAKLNVRPKAFAGPVRVTASGPADVSVSASGRKGSYRARLVLRVPGTWTLRAAAGGSTSQLGHVTVRRRAQPLVFVYPTSVALEPTGSVLVAENGRDRVYRVDPRTGKETLLADHLSRAYSLLVSDGQTLVSSDNDIVRLEPAPREVVATAPDQIGPITAAPNGDLYFTAANTAFRLARESRTPVAVATGLAVPHGVAVAADGAVLVSDTEHNRILRVDPSGSVTTFSELERPGGMAVAADGTVYVCAALAGRVVRFAADGTRIGFVGPNFLTPYAVATDGEGGIYVAEATEEGHIRRVSADGKVTTLSAG